ncbi:QueT transporter family protein [Clostridium sp. AM58-1XD]|uniref:QueT transporter family protein n=1 Tax=Clostridium sp. AM58-1XD TaxID=2292307 RepID=UPI000E51D34A|nr:QueT transporter family protein [Clostridium sp. AM58-1XD]RGY96175.1 QueT transporter family protein [Clostridium sp. AM58-1XD]
MLQKSNKTVYFMAHSAMIAAIYVVITMSFSAISFGPVQFRISEALCILPYFTPAAIPGLFLGCFLSNFLYGAAVLDVVFGSAATLIGAAGSYALRRNKRLVCIPPILSNMIIVPWVLRYAYGSESMIVYLMVTVGIGEILAVGVLGNLLMVTLDKYKMIIFRKHFA